MGYLENVFRYISLSAHVLFITMQLIPYLLAVSTTQISDIDNINDSGINPCRIDQFQCPTYKFCIQSIWKCDGEMDCGYWDPSDEMDCEPETCYSKNLLFCNVTRKCFKPENRCDHINNCGEGDTSDENDCGDICLTWQFQCTGTKKCIWPEWRCNSIVDCEDGSDEIDCDYCQNENFYRSMTYDPVFCNLSRTCINNKYLCDNKTDCGEGDLSDEIHCVNCTEDELRCNGGTKCVPTESICDGISDCEDSLDEKNCESCRPNSYYCERYKKCQMLLNKCDGKGHCDRYDWSNVDEEHCDSCSYSAFHCNATKTCIPIADRCNGFANCGALDNSDEENCEFCLTNQFQCKVTKKCIRIRDRCDGVYDCGSNDKSDEVDCGLCSPYSFQCEITKECIPFQDRCNGKNDCGQDDESDESNCDSCPENYFRCDGKPCYPQIYRCDGYRDCSDYSDEINCTSCAKNAVHCKSTNTCTKHREERLGNCPGHETTFRNALVSIYLEPFQCKTTKLLLHPGLKCDGFVDCGSNDTSDEENCDACVSWRIINHRVHHLFHCNFSRRCIPLFRTCDGTYDCGSNDFSDEENCYISRTEIGSFVLTNNKSRIEYTLKSWNENKIDLNSKKYKLFITQSEITNLEYNLALEIKNATFEDSGNYTLHVTITDKNGVTNTFSFFFTVTVRNGFPLPPRFAFTNLKNKTILFTPGKILKLVCIAANTTESLQTQVTWTWGNKSMENWDSSLNYSFERNNQILHLHKVPLERPGRFTCTAENSKGSISAYADVAIESLEQDIYRILGPVGGLIAVLFVGFGIIVWWHKYKERGLIRKLYGLTESDFYLGGIENLNPSLSVKEQANLLPFEKNKWEIPRDKLKLGVPLGSGAFGLVLNAELLEKDENNAEKWNSVAVKTIKACADESQFKALVMELKIMANLGKHLNIVNMIGACTENFIKTRELLIVMELCKYGSLLSFLSKNRKSFINQLDPITDKVYPNISKTEGATNEAVDHTEGHQNYLVQNLDTPKITLCQEDYQLHDLESLTSTTLLSWGYQIAKGMEYLSSKKIFHGDLAARNILLGENSIAKICDFGYARETLQNLDYQKDTTGQLLPIKWMAIESICQGIFSSKTDCWSFGVVLWELFTLGNKPYPGMLIDGEFCQRLMDGYRMEKPLLAPMSVYNIMMDCWKEEPTERPTFSDLASSLSQMIPDLERQRLVEMNDVYVALNERNMTTDYFKGIEQPTILPITYKQAEYVNSFSTSSNDLFVSKLSNKPTCSVTYENMIEMCTEPKVGPTTPNMFR